MLRQPVPCCGWAATALDCWKVVLPGRPPIPPEGGPAHQGAGDRQHLLLQALHPDRAQRPRPNEQHGQHRWSEGRAERPGAPPTVH
jgi:hypothetical protein